MDYPLLEDGRRLILYAAYTLVQKSGWLSENSKDRTRVPQALWRKSVAIRPEGNPIWIMIFYPVEKCRA